MERGGDVGSGVLGRAGRWLAGRLVRAGGGLERLVQAAIEKDVAFDRMAMEVAVHENGAAALLERAEESFERVDCGVSVGGGVFVAAIQVMACQIAPVVALNDAIGVEHRDDSELKRLPKPLGVRVAARQKGEDSPHHPGGIRLSRVHPR